MRAVHAGVIMALLMSPAPAIAAGQKSAGAPPHVLNITRVRIKAKDPSTYSALESQIVRAFEHARARVYWIGLQSPKDARDVLYLNLFSSTDDLNHATESFRTAAAAHPDLTQLQRRLADLTASTNSTVTTRRDDIDRAVPEADFATMRTLRVTTFQVVPGREGEFIKAIRTASPKDGAWLVYEANDSSTFLLITLKKSAINRSDGPAIPRTLRHGKGLYVKSDSRVYTVKPAMSHVTQAFVAANPQLWRQPSASGTH
ncbi:MAG TPA: hypothetical protein VH497_11360 [Vicinamibacterales bacterium]